MDAALPGRMHRLLSAYACAGRYADAFAVGEALLDRFGRMPMPQALQWPWWLKVPPAAPPERFLRAQLERLDSAPRKGAPPHWFAYCRGLLLLKLGDRRASLSEHDERVARSDQARYDFMRLPFVVVKLALQEGSSGWVLETGRGLLDREPGLWELRCRVAEALLARGEAALGLSEFDRAARSAEDAMRPAVWAWHGEALLWLGRYRAALRRLDAALAAGPTPFARVWRGAAYLKLGRPADALRELDAARRQFPGDPELPMWRGEALRRLGRLPEARREFDRAVGSGFHWALYGRALVSLALGDGKAAAADLADIPAGELAYVRGRLRPPAGRRPAGSETRRVLEAALRLAKGVRRSELFLRRVWMR